ncbi:MAG: DUF6932 family protein [Longimicrobiaceae bacterium]
MFIFQDGRLAVKSEYPPLLAPGFHRVKEEELAALFVDSFSSPDRRRRLLARFHALIDHVREWNIPCDVWIDGSFATEKPDPQDVDALFVFDGEAVNRASSELHAAMSAVFGREGHRDTKLRYGCDAYMVINQDEQTRSYWRGWFAFTRSDEPKGVPVLRVYP